MKYSDKEILNTAYNALKEHRDNTGVSIKDIVRDLHNLSSFNIRIDKSVELNSHIVHLLKRNGWVCINKRWTYEC